MAKTITIGEGGTAYTISASAKFDISCEPQINLNGTIDSMLWRVSVIGDLVASTPATVSANMVSLIEQASEQTMGVRVVIAEGASTLWDFQPAQGLSGPFVTLAKTSEKDGNGASHWMYQLEISFDAIATGGESSFNLQTSITTVTFNGKLIRKIWKASCSAKTAAIALTKVLTFKPSETYQSEEIERRFQDAAAAGTWIWEANKSGVLTVDCDVDYGPGGGQDYVEQPQAGKSVDPILFEARRKPQIITVRYLVRSFKSSIPALPAHFSEGGGLNRATARETRHDAKIEDSKRGIYRRMFEEVWIATTDQSFVADHKDHNIIKFDTEPGDGTMAS